VKLFEYGIQPEVMGDYADARLLASHLGLRAKRMVSAYPSWKKWRKWALEASARGEAGDRQLAKHQQLIRSLDRAIVETDGSYDPEIEWLPNALEQQSREETRFQGIVATTNLDGRSDVLEIDEIDGDNSVWNPASDAVEPLELEDELNGGIDQFGDRFWELLARHSPGLSKRLTGRCPITSVELRDRYVKSPLTLRLAVEVFNQLGEFPCASTHRYAGRISTVFMVGGGGRTLPSLIQHDWQPGIARETVIERVSTDLGIDLRLEECKRRESIHWRDLTIEWGDGARWTVILDEGLGFLEPSGACQFDFRADAEGQARILLEADCTLRRRSSAPTKFYLNGSILERELG